MFPWLSIRVPFILPAVLFVAAEINPGHAWGRPGGCRGMSWRNMGGAGRHGGGRSAGMYPVHARSESVSSIKRGVWGRDTAWPRSPSVGTLRCNAGVSDWGRALLALWYAAAAISHGPAVRPWSRASKMTGVCGLECCRGGCQRVVGDALCPAAVYDFGHARVSMKREREVGERWGRCLAVNSRGLNQRRMCDLMGALDLASCAKSRLHPLGVRGCDALRHVSFGDWAGGRGRAG